MSGMRRGYLKDVENRMEKRREKDVALRRGDGRRRCKQCKLGSRDLSGKGSYSELEGYKSKISGAHDHLVERTYVEAMFRS